MELIHPQYIVGMVDSGSASFKIKMVNIEYIFTFNIYSNDVKLLYKIKKRFKVGKVIELDTTKVLKISTNIEDIIQFFRKNKLLNTKHKIEFLRWSYLYQKLIIEKDIEKQPKEIQRINKRLNCMI